MIIKKNILKNYRSLYKNRLSNWLKDFNCAILKKYDFWNGLFTETFNYKYYYNRKSWKDAHTLYGNFYKNLTKF